MLVAFGSAALAQSVSQSCPISISFGVHSPLPLDKSVQAELEITYFTTEDPNVFISEKAGINRSASKMTLNTNEFVAKLQKLEAVDLASIKKRQSATSYMGETAKLNLERGSGSADGRMISTSMDLTNPNSVYSLERETEINISKDSSNGGGYYRVMLLSWFVDTTTIEEGRKVLDYDVDILLKPGQTVLLKLMSDYETRRSGQARSYMAVTMRSVSPGRLASMKGGLTQGNEGTK